MLHIVVQSWLNALLVLGSPLAVGASAQPGADPGCGAPVQAAPLRVAQLDGYLQAQVQKGFHGVVLVARGGEVVLEQAYGAKGDALSPTTLFWAGSLSKQFAAAAVLKLVEQGKLRLTDPITRFWPTAPSDKRAITVQHLLTHTAGLGRHNFADGVSSRDGAARRLLAGKSGSAFGTYAYCGDGYNLLAIIVELASGMSYEEYLQTQLFQPAGLQATGFWGQPLPTGSVAPLAPPGKSVGRVPKNQKGVFHDGQPVANYGYRGSTGVATNVGDLYKWIMALQQGRVLADSSRQKLFGPHAFVRQDPSPRDTYYGYGWMVIRENDRTTEIRHAGAEDWLGHNGMLRLMGEDMIIVFSNAGTVEGREWSMVVSEGLRQRLRS